jgi:hypothetical protein
LLPLAFCFFDNYPDVGDDIQIDADHSQDTGHGRGNGISPRRGAGNHRFDTRRLGRTHTHDSGAGMGKPAAGHVAAGHVHGDNALSKADAVHGPHFKLVDALPLGPGKGCHLIMGIAVIRLDRLRQLVDEALFLFRTQDEVTFPVVEFSGQLDDGLLPVCLYAGQDLFHSAANTG